MRNKKQIIEENYWEKYGTKVIGVSIVGVVIIYGCFVTAGFIPSGIELKKSDWLSFIGGYLSFVGSLFLGSVALWQNEKANEINENILKIQKRQLGANKSILLPIMNDTEHPSSKGQFASLSVEKQNLQVGLQNRGPDYIHKQKVLEKRLNGVLLEEEIKPSMSMELDDKIYYNFDTSSIRKNNSRENIEIELVIEMQNSCGVVYTEYFFATYKYVFTNQYEYYSYNFYVEENE